MDDMKIAKQYRWMVGTVCELLLVAILGPTLVAGVLIQVGIGVGWSIFAGAAAVATWSRFRLDKLLRKQP